MIFYGYESGWFNLFFVGICIFGKFFYQLDWDVIDVDVVVLGVLFDFGIQW